MKTTNRSPKTTKQFTRSQRLKFLRLGRWAETIAAMMLRLKGYRILHRRHRVCGVEVDLIVARGNVVAFVEVKYRRTISEAYESLTFTQKKRLSGALEPYLLRLKRPYAGRCDVILVAPWSRPRHLTDAF